ncbi:MAG: hypothetical protein ACJ8GN_01525 [Longimicrobiaceae bacterium]
MRRYIVALGTLLALSGTALAPSVADAQGAGDPRIPLRPGGVGVKLEHRFTGEVRIVGVLPGSPAEASGLGREDCVLLAVDGRPVGFGGWHALTALAGPVGTPVEVTVRRGRAVRTVRMARGDVLAPNTGYTEVVLTRRFVVHHHPGPAAAREARRLARDAERRYATSGLPRDTRGRRAHLWVAGMLQFRENSLPAWATYTQSEWGSTTWGSLVRVFGYLAYGDPGQVGEEAFGATLGMGKGGPGREQVRWAHMATALEFEHAAAESRRTGTQQVVAPIGYISPWRPYGGKWGSTEEMSLRHYTLDRFGIERFRRLWASDLTFNDAVRRELGVSAEEYLRGWEAYVRTLGPDPRAPLSAGVVAGTFAWVGLALLFGARVAHTKELD